MSECNENRKVDEVRTRRYNTSTPYINHLTEVARILNGMAGITDQELLQAAVLNAILDA